VEQHDFDYDMNKYQCDPMLDLCSLTCAAKLLVMTLGHGAVYASSMRQKLNTKILTEAELAGVNDLIRIRQTG